MNNKKDLAISAPNELVADSNKFEDYLSGLGLPTENILASTEERAVVGQNIANFISSVDSPDRKDARYLSKFVCAASIGLFDASLNYVWNEVVVNLRKKAISYGVDLFFDAAVGGKNRDLYTTEEDLSGLKDSVLLQSCRKLELISSVVYRKLENILTMRNEVAASHPNQEEIGGYELLGWLQTCVRDVIQDKPSDSAIQIQQIVNNLKSQTSVLNEDDFLHFEKNLQNLSSAHIHNLLISLFGMFVSDHSDQTLRKNVSLIAPAVWNSSLDSVKTKVALRLDGYKTNLNQDKVDRTEEFLKQVGGLNFLSISTKSIKLNDLVVRLNDAHSGWDNFYNEPPIASEIMQHFDDASEIPQDMKLRLVNIMLHCRLGNGVSYNSGVSPAAKPFYNSFFEILDDEGIAMVLKSLISESHNYKTKKSIAKSNYRSFFQLLRDKLYQIG